MRVEEHDLLLDAERVPLTHAAVPACPQGGGGPGAVAPFDRFEVRAGEARNVHAASIARPRGAPQGGVHVHCRRACIKAPRSPSRPRRAGRAMGDGHGRRWSGEIGRAHVATPPGVPKRPAEAPTTLVDWYGL